MSNSAKIWNFLKGCGLNDFAVAGVMGNLKAESALNPQNLQQTYEKSLGHTDASYTAAVDDGSYTNFVWDAAGYGLAQWTYWSRKQNLMNYAQSKGASIGDLTMQLEFLWQEMQTYKSLMAILDSAKTVSEASNAVLAIYERPADMGESAQTKRASYGQSYYDLYATSEFPKYCVVAAVKQSLSVAFEQVEELKAAGYTEAYVIERPDSETVVTPSEKEEPTQVAPAPVQPTTPSSKLDPAKVIAVALAEVGYLEKASNAQLDDPTANAGSANYTKFARDLDAIGFYNGRKNGVAWCDVFVDSCFVTAYGKDAALAMTFQPTKAADNCGAGCIYSRRYYQNNGRLFDSPQVGDQIFFYNSDLKTVGHTGLVYKVDSKYVYTVEGNTSSDSGVVANGGSVNTKRYSLTYKRLAGFGRPMYDKVYEQESSEGYIQYTVKKGDTLWGIARTYLGNGNDWKRISELNNLTSTTLNVGQTLKIPS